MEKTSEKEIMICILNNRASLTIGKEYEVVSSYDYRHNASASDVYISVINDGGYLQEYVSLRFMPKSEFRNIKLNQILK